MGRSSARFGSSVANQLLENEKPNTVGTGDLAASMRIYLGWELSEKETACFAGSHAYCKNLVKNYSWNSGCPPGLNVYKNRIFERSQNSK